jgi:hypothetical protein
MRRRFVPEFLEKKLLEKYGGDKATAFKIMNKLGVVRGNKETAKGRSWDKKHAADVRKGKA